MFILSFWWFCVHSFQTENFLGVAKKLRGHVERLMLPSWNWFLLDGKPFSLLYGCRMKPKSETQILWQGQAREVLLHGGTVDSFVRPYHPDLRFAAFRAYIGAVRDALFRPRTARRQSKRSP
jgi:hypothetical protein